MEGLHFIVVCTFGAGSSLMLKMNVEGVLKDIGHPDATVEVCDMGSCKNKEATAYLCSIVLYENLNSQDVGAPVVAIKNFYSKEELAAALKPFTDKIQ